MNIVDFYNSSDPKVQASIISGIASIITTIIAAVTAGLVGKWVTNRRKIKKNLNIAMNDIEFLRRVEEKHCERNKEKLKTSYKNITREDVRESGLHLSDKFTITKIKSRRHKNLFHNNEQ